MGKYDAERYEPKVPICGVSGLSLHFNGRFLRMSGGSKEYYYNAVSGQRGREGFDYSLRSQRSENRGPIPTGDYWINPSELWDNALYKRGSLDAWGEHRITIHPFPTTITHGRGGFFIHGGKVPGSIGCIDLTKEITTFVSDLKNEVGGKSNCYIKLKVEYL